MARVLPLSHAAPRLAPTEVLTTITVAVSPGVGAAVSRAATDLVARAVDEAGSTRPVVVAALHVAAAVPRLPMPER